MGTGRRLAISIYVWFALAVTFSTLDILPRLPVPAIAGIIVAVLVLFLARAFATKQSRTFISSLNLRWVTMFHLWRIVPGIAFLVFYSVDLLPGRFALPFGIGDIVIALSAPILANRFEFAHKKILLGWHILGSLDICLAMAVAVYLAMTGEARIMLMTHFPMSMMGLFFVPLTLAMHTFAFYIFRTQK